MSQTPSNAVLVQQLQKNLLSQATKTVGLPWILTQLPSLMTSAEKIPSTNGLDRKQLILQALKTFVTIEVTDATSKQNMLSYIDNVLPLTIDTVVSATKGQININQFATEVVTEGVATCFYCCGKASTS